MVDVIRLARLYLPDWYITAIHAPASIASGNVQTQARRPTDPDKRNCRPALSESSTQWGRDWYSLAPPLIFHLRHHRDPGSYYVTACCYDNRKRWRFQKPVSDCAHLQPTLRQQSTHWTSGNMSIDVPVGCR